MFQEANSQTYVWGNPVGYTSEQVVNLVASGNAYNSNSPTYSMLGFALKAARNTTSPGATVLGISGPAWRIQDVPVILVGPAYDVEFLLPMGDSNGGTAPYSAMQPGDKATLYCSSGGVWFVDMHYVNGSYPVVQMTAKEPGILETATQQVAWFRWINAESIID
jgi:hypothetical protein